LKRLALAIALIAQACARAPSLETLEASGVRALQAGDLTTAQASADQGRRRADAGHDAQWQRRFRALAIEVFLEQRNNPEALKLLAAEPAPTTVADRLALRFLVARGRALCLSAGSPDALRAGEADLANASAAADTLQAPEMAAEIARHRGNCALARRDYPAAETRFRDALDRAHRHGLPLLEVKATGSLGVIRVQTRRLDDAVVWLNKALVLATNLKADLVAVKTLTNLGWCQYALGDYPRALTFLAKADALAEARGYRGERELALEMMGNVHYSLGDFDKAAAAYRRSLALATELDDRQRMAELLGNLGTIQLEQGRYDEADASVAESLRIKTARDDEAARRWSVVEQGDIAARRGDYAKADALYAQLLASPGLDPELQWLTRAGLAAVRMKTGRFPEADQEFRQAFDVIERSRSELRRTDHKISFLSSLYRFYRQYVDFLVTRGETARALEVADRSRARLLRETESTDASRAAPEPQQFRQVARALNATILFYWLAPERSFLWTITPADVQIHVLPGDAAIRAHVDAHQSLVLRSRDPLKESAADAEWLYHTLIEPAGSAVASGAHVVFIPDGVLHQINPETFVVHSPSPHYWVEDVTLLVAPSLPTLAADGDRSRGQSAEPSILLVGDPVASGEEFPRLQHAGREMTAIGDQFPPSRRTVRAGIDANPKAYLTSSPARFSLVHFAAHAEANAEAPLESAVILSAAGDTPKLYARDILDVPLRAELVTISGCRSAGSRTYSGEGQVGLAWAFMRAGAHRVIAGLWNVEDASTSELMDALYRGLTHGEPPEEALRHAKLRLIRSEGAYRKPYYWAPFMLYTRSAQAAGRSAVSTTQ
jgi:CHAT domain-containing protein